MSWKKGWIEMPHMKVGQAVQLLDYRIVQAAEFPHLAKDANYAHTSLLHSAIASLMAGVLHADLQDLLNSRVMICSQDPLQHGQHLEVQVKVPGYNCELKFLMEAAAIGFEAEMKEMVFSAGIKILGVHKGDMEFLNLVIQKKKEKG